MPTFLSTYSSPSLVTFRGSSTLCKSPTGAAKVDRGRFEYRANCRQVYHLEILSTRAGILPHAVIPMELFTQHYFLSIPPCHLRKLTLHESSMVIILVDSVFGWF